MLIFFLNFCSFLFLIVNPFFASSSSIWMMNEIYHLEDFKEDFQIYCFENDFFKNCGDASLSLKKKNYTLSQKKTYQLNLSYRFRFQTNQKLIDNTELFHSYHELILNEKFQILSFSGFIKEDNKKKKRNGYYRYPYLYLFQDEKLFRIYKSDTGVFSSFIVNYLVRFILKNKGQKLKYEFLNLFSLALEEEEIFYQGKSKIKSKNTQIFKEAKNFFIKNRTTNESWTYYYNDKNQLLQKTDFRKYILWQNNQF